MPRSASAAPATIGADVCHLNLHKTFCIPHGGGGPGMGPIGVKAHLAPFLPGASARIRRAAPVGPVVGRALGLAQHPADLLGLYAAHGRRRPHRRRPRSPSSTPTTSPTGWRAIIRCFTTASNGASPTSASSTCARSRKRGVTVEDVAKRLMDYGFHAPTMCLPVPGTLMVEPTESESKAELDRFCDALIAIRAEIRAIESGRMPKQNNLLKNAPHTASISPTTIGTIPIRASRRFSGRAGDDKYWCPVDRIDNVYGDRNLFCSCPPVMSYSETAQ